MITTSDLIEALAANLVPVRPLKSPVVRTAKWLLLAGFVVALVGISQGPRPDLLNHLRDPYFIVTVASAVLTGILAAAAAFFVSLPDRSPLWFLLPAPSLVLWLSTVGYQCLTDWVKVGPNGIGLGEAAQCFATLGLTSLPLALAMLIMLRHAAPLRPRSVCLMGSLAVAAITATALLLFHALDATVLILIWNLGTAIVLMGFGGVYARRMLS